MLTSCFVRFFKDRHWTTREFEELLGGNNSSGSRRSLLEIGCGVGNLFYPLLESGICLRVYACDFSPRAVAFVKEHPLYDPDRVTAFVADITKVRRVESVDSYNHILYTTFLIFLCLVLQSGCTMNEIS